MNYTKKQKEALRLWQKGGLKRINIFSGAVRSGKTVASVILFALFVASSPKGSRFLMGGRTLKSLERNVLDIMKDMFGVHFSFSTSKKEAELFGRKIYLEGVSDKSAESKIRGLTLFGAYLDELTLLPENFFSMLLSRLSDKGAKLIATTNPDSPNHWLYKNYLTRDELDINDIKFSLEDNTFLDEKYIEALKKEYTGVFYKRFIEGKWVVAEGLVYPMFSKEKHVLNKEIPQEGQFYISVDYGSVNPCSMGLWYVSGCSAHRVREFYHDSKKTHTVMTDAEYYEALESLAGTYPIQYVVVDPSATSFIEVIRRNGRFSVKKADNDVLAGIRRTALVLSEGRLTFSPSCRDILREFSEYAFDDTANTDKVIKESDHAMDDMRYFVNTVMRFAR
ncbi:MAG: PBSX family phage terminase large subunit [Clostridia bacterium]|nr:PBSX family phage terminase large subunit [Clostridia bacterium]